MEPEARRRIVTRRVGAKNAARLVPGRGARRAAVWDWCLFVVEKEAPRISMNARSRISPSTLNVSDATAAFARIRLSIIIESVIHYSVFLRSGEISLIGERD